MKRLVERQTLSWSAAVPAYAALLNRGGGTPITSLHYFVGLLDEIDRLETSITGPYVAGKLRDLEARWRATCPNGLGRASLRHFLGRCLRNSSGVTHFRLHALRCRRKHLQPRSNSAGKARRLRGTRARRKQTAPQLLVGELGSPLTIGTGRDIRGDGSGAQRPNYVGGDQYAANRTILQWFNRDAFALPATGTFGNLGAYTVRTPGNISVDLSVIKRIRLAETQELQFRAEFFSLPNHPNFGAPNSTFTSSTFGRITSASGNRQVQLGLRYEF